MQLKAFTIPVHEVDAFLRSRRVLSVDRHFVQDGANNGRQSAGRMRRCLPEGTPVGRFFSMEV